MFPSSMTASLSISAGNPILGLASSTTIRGNVTPLSCGVAMCTCNGKAFLEGQLRSLVEQTCVPDQIVVSDDMSDDGTWEQLNSWAEVVRRRYKVRVTLLRNTKRLGVTRNFEQAIRAVDTDIIFLADQDDIWASNKVELLSARLESDPYMALAHSDAFLIDDNDNDLGRSLFEALRLSAAERMLVQQQRFFEVYCRRNLVTGTTVAFRRELLDLALPFPGDWIHDEWLAACAATIANVAMLPEKLTNYRQHGTNAIGMPATALSRIAFCASRIAAMGRDDHLHYKVRRLQAWKRRLIEAGITAPEKVALLNEAQMHFNKRLKFRRGILARLPPVFAEFKSRGYHRFGDGFVGIARDILNI
ncbi:glycosyltransferase family 2 protein [Paraburkholderia sediminicola]|uniref:glycosyltransferase family 2 protein n=1 Tax=Paraburkholderia sediminicola TaxID=458836 RepID=UPI0038BB80FD